MPRSYNELGLVYSNAGYDYSGVTTFTSAASGVGIGDTGGTATFVSKGSEASGSGIGTSGSSTLHICIRSASASGNGTSGSNASITPAVRRTASSSGVGSSTSVRVRSVIRDNQEGNAYGTQSATGLLTRIVVSSGTGIGSESASWLRTRLRTASGSALGASSSSRTIIRIRSASGVGLGTQTNTRLMTAKRTSTSVGVGGVDVALWKNVGKTLDGRVVMPPRRSSVNPYLIRRR